MNFYIKYWKRNLRDRGFKLTSQIIVANREEAMKLYFTSIGVRFTEHDRVTLTVDDANIAGNEINISVWRNPNVVIPFKGSP